jgi:hypothetical protein
MLNAAGSAALAQGTAQPGPAPEAQQPAPPPGYEGNAYVGVPYPVIGVLLATFAMGVYILTKNHHGTFSFPQPPPNSPG